MDIWSQISKNLFQRARTRRPEAAVPYPEGFRGELLHDASRCTACGTCAYVCSPSAIAVESPSPDQASPDGHATWQYQMLSCTFCGRCVDFCPTGALSFDSRLPRPLFAMQPTAHQIAYQPCERCGKPVIPLPRPVLVATYGDPLPAEIEHLNRLCDRCRKKVTGANVKRGFTGK